MEACCVLPLGLWVAALLGGFLLRLCCCLVRAPVPKIQHAAAAFALTWFIYLFTLFVNSTSLGALGRGSWRYAVNPYLTLVHVLVIVVNVIWAGWIAAFIYRWLFDVPLRKGALIWVIQAAVLFALYFGMVLALLRTGFFS